MVEDATSGKLSQALLLFSPYTISWLEKVFTYTLPLAMVGQFIFEKLPGLSAGFMVEFQSSVVTSSARTALKTPLQRAWLALHPFMAWVIQSMAVVSLAPFDETDIYAPDAPVGPLTLPLTGFPREFAPTLNDCSNVFSENW